MSLGTLIALASCAVLNTATMSPFCRDSYNLCLDGCPKPPEIPHNDWDTSTPSCVDACNKNAATCK